MVLFEYRYGRSWGLVVIADDEKSRTYEFCSRFLEAVWSNGQSRVRDIRTPEF